MAWKVVGAALGSTELAALLALGYEPFGVTKGAASKPDTIYVRKMEFDAGA